jgi:hypothetical protein
MSHSFGPQFYLTLVCFCRLHSAWEAARDFASLFHGDYFFSFFFVGCNLLLHHMVVTSSTCMHMVVAVKQSRSRTLPKSMGLNFPNKTLDELLEHMTAQMGINPGLALSCLLINDLWICKHATVGGCCKLDQSKANCRQLYFSTKLSGLCKLYHKLLQHNLMFQLT